MGYGLDRLDELVLMAAPKPMLTEFGIHHKLESCDANFMANVVVKRIISIALPDILGACS